MKNLFKKLVISILTLEARLVLKRFNPKIIAVVGSVGKTTSKDAIYTALSSSKYVRKNIKSFNSEIGAPLTILGLPTGWSNPGIWVSNIIKGAIVAFKFSYPKILILETGVDRPGDMDRIGKWLSPDVIVYTTFPLVPVHVEYFNSPQEVIAEKKKLIKYMKKDGVLILNGDDSEVIKIKNSADKLTYIYGSDPKSDISFSNESIVYKDEKPVGISFKVNYQGNVIPINLPGVLGVQHVFPVVSALAVGIVEKIPFLDMAQAFKKHEPPKSRMSLVEGINGSTIIDDTYNSSPAALTKAIEVFDTVRTDGSKIIVVGDMLELGKFSEREHRHIGRLVAKVKPDFLHVVGPRAVDIFKEAIKEGFDESRVFQYANSNEVGDELIKQLENNSVVLVKGSQGSRMEKIVKKIMNKPEDAKKLIARQEDYWLDN